jgi:hypothetical protein
MLKELIEKLKQDSLEIENNIDTKLLMENYERTKTYIKSKIKDISI